MWLFKYGYIVLYIITLSVGFYHLKKYKHNLQLKLWFCFLIYSFLNECIGRYIIEIYSVRTYRLSNTWFILNSLFYLLFYYFLINSILKKRVILWLIGIYVVIVFCNLFYLDFSKDYFPTSWIAGQLFIVIAVIMYFLELLNSDAILNIQKSMFFWISLGVLFFNIILIPVFVIGELIDWQGIFKYIIFGANLILSLSFITGFIISKKEFNN